MLSENVKPIFAMHVISTGELILEEPVVGCKLGTWQRRTQGKIMRRKNRAERYRDAIRRHDVIASVANYDALRDALPAEQLFTLIAKIFSGYDDWFEMWRESNHET